MAEEDVSHLEQRLLSDDTLREQFRQNPHEVLEGNGIPLDDRQREKLSRLDLPSKSDEHVRGSLQTEGLRAFL